MSLLWHSAGDAIGAPMGGHTRQAIEWLGYFSGLGVLANHTDTAGGTGSWFPVPDEGDLPSGLQGLFAKARERLGFVPNVFRVYAFGPSALAPGSPTSASFTSRPST